MVTALIDPVRSPGTGCRSGNVAPHELAEERRSLQAGVHSELGEDVLDVGPGRLRAHQQRLPDRLVRRP
jgi:hypothetical protein